VIGQFYLWPGKHSAAQRRPSLQFGLYKKRTKTDLQKLKQFIQEIKLIDTIQGKRENHNPPKEETK
jgi:hypothetical protein